MMTMILGVERNGVVVRLAVYRFGLDTSFIPLIAYSVDTLGLYTTDAVVAFQVAMQTRELISFHGPSFFLCSPSGHY